MQLLYKFVCWIHESFSFNCSDLDKIESDVVDSAPALSLRIAKQGKNQLPSTAIFSCTFIQVHSAGQSQSTNIGWNCVSAEST